MSRYLAVIGCLLVAVVSGAPVKCFSENKMADVSKTSTVTTATGLKYRDEKIGSGPAAVPGKIVSVHYTGWLDSNGEPGTQFDSSRGRKPFEFRLGAQQVIAGWDEGVSGMKVGGIRRLIIPTNLAYGERGAGHIIKPGDGLIFDVELLAVK